MRLADVAIQASRQKLSLPGYSSPKRGPQSDGYQAVQSTVEKQRIHCEVLLACLDRKLGADESEVTSEFDQEALEPT
jgi:hypothetical protein